MKLRLFAVAGLAALLIAPADGWCPEPGIGKDQSGKSNSGPGHEGSSNRDSHTQKDLAGHHSGDKDHWGAQDQGIMSGKKHKSSSSGQDNGKKGSHKQGGDKNDNACSGPHC